MIKMTGGTYHDFPSDKFLYQSTESFLEQISGIKNSLDKKMG